MIDMEVANPFIILSAYFITAAIISPPKALSTMINQATEFIPWNQPFSNTALISTKYTFNNANMIPKKPLILVKLN
jgi:hypothetical protein